MKISSKGQTQMMDGTGLSGEEEEAYIPLVRECKKPASMVTGYIYFKGV